VRVGRHQRARQQNHAGQHVVDLGRSEQRARCGDERDETLLEIDLSLFRECERAFEMRVAGINP